MAMGGTTGGDDNNRETTTTIMMKMCRTEWIKSYSLTKDSNIYLYGRIMEASTTHYTDGVCNSSNIYY
jgi:hypothetical protein